MEGAAQALVSMEFKEKETEVCGLVAMEREWVVEKGLRRRCKIGDCAPVDGDSKRRIYRKQTAKSDRHFHTHAHTHLCVKRRD